MASTPASKPPSSFPSASSQQPTPPPSRPVSQSQASQPSGLRYPSNRKTIYDRNLNRTRTAELSRASFAYLFAEMVSYAQKRVTGIQDLERRLSNLGHPLGLRLLPLLLHRPANPSSSSSSPLPPRPNRILPLLQFIARPLWTHLFARPADAIESSATNSNEYMITDNEPLVNQYISVPKEMSQLNCAAFVAGIIEGVCKGLGMGAGVSAHWVNNPNERGEGKAGEEMWPGKTVFLIRFEEGVVEREKLVGG